MLEEKKLLFKRFAFLLYVLWFGSEVISEIRKAGICEVGILSLLRLKGLK